MTEPEGCEAIAYEWSMGYAMRHASVPLARVHARRQLTLWRWPGDVRDALLIVSELVTNAVQHGWRPGHWLWLRLTLHTDATLHIDVSDPISTTRPTPRDTPPDETDEHGRGLFLAHGLGAHLTCFPREHRGKTIRATLLRGTDHTCHHGSAPLHPVPEAVATW